MISHHSQISNKCALLNCLYKNDDRESCSLINHKSTRAAGGLLNDDKMCCPRSGLNLLEMCEGSKIIVAL